MLSPSQHFPFNIKLSNLSFNAYITYRFMVLTYFIFSIMELKTLINLIIVKDYDSLRFNLIEIYTKHTKK